MRREPALQRTKLAPGGPTVVRALLPRWLAHYGRECGVDNLFVISVIFSFFSIPRSLQLKVLFWGFLGRFGVTYFSPSAIFAAGGVGAGSGEPPPGRAGPSPAAAPPARRRGGSR